MTLIERRRVAHHSAIIKKSGKRAKDLKKFKKANLR